MLTGCRLSEIQKLRWEHVDIEAGELRLPDTKTGRRTTQQAARPECRWTIGRYDFLFS